MMEKCQNKANLLVAVLGVTRTNQGGIEPEKRSQFPAGGCGVGRGA